MNAITKNPNCMSPLPAIFYFGGYGRHLMRRHGFGWSKKKYGDHRLHDTRRCLEPERRQLGEPNTAAKSVASWVSSLSSASSSVPLRTTPPWFSPAVPTSLPDLSSLFSFSFSTSFPFFVTFWEVRERSSSAESSWTPRDFSCPSHLPLVHAATCSCCLGCRPISPKQLRTMTMLMIVAKQMTDWRELARTMGGTRDATWRLDVNPVRTSGALYVDCK